MTAIAPRALLILLLAVSFDVFAQEAPVADFYVSPVGNDAFSGTLAEVNKKKTDGPFKTLQRARDAVRNEIKPNGNDIVVMLRGGRYLLTATVCFGLRDSGKNGQRIIYRNYPNEEPVLTPATEITGWRKLTDDIAGLPEVAKGNIWVADLAPGIKPFKALYEGGRRLPCAVSDGFSALKDGRADPTVSHTQLFYPPGVALKNWPNIGDVDLLVRPTYEWAMYILPLKSVDEKARIATVAVPSYWPLGKLWTQTPRDVDNVWIENAIEFLDKPDEWVLNTKQRRLYFWPINGERPMGVMAPQLTELVKVEGNIDYNGPTDVPVKNITFHGLTFAEADRYTLPNDYVERSLGNWAVFDTPSAMVRFRGAENCVIENCQFRDSAAGAIRLDLYCQHNTIHNNLIGRIGGVGILLDGYGMGTKDVNRGNRVTNNYLHDVGQIYWASPAIDLSQSGENRVAHNLISDTPYSGIMIGGGGLVRWAEVGKYINPKDPDMSPTGFKSWSRRARFLHARDNIIEKNDIRGVMQKLGDGNGIYLAGTGPQNIVRLNYVHDCLSLGMRAGIRCDYDEYEATIEGNVIYKNGGTAEGIDIKGKNKVINNIVADLVTEEPENESCFLWLQVYHVDGAVIQVYPVDGAVIQRNILYSDDKRQRACDATGAYFYKGPIPEWKTTKADYNDYFCTQDPGWVAKHFAAVRPFGVETHSICADPMFTDIEHGIFTLKTGSPALKLGFEPIDVSQAGLTKDFPGRLLDGQDNSAAPVQ